MTPTSHELSFKRRHPTERLTENPIEAHIKTLSFQDRQKFLQDLLDVKDALMKQVRVVENGIELIDGSRVYIEQDEDGTCFVGNLDLLTHTDTIEASSYISWNIFTTRFPSKS